MAQNAVRVMKAQGTGGCLLFNTSKQAVNPGKDFGPYGLPKASTLFLMKQYALDHGKDGIRSNAVNADRIRTGLLTDDMVAPAPKRAAFRRETTWAAICWAAKSMRRRSRRSLRLSAPATPEKTTAGVITVDWRAISKRVASVSASAVRVGDYIPSVRFMPQLCAASSL